MVSISSNSTSATDARMVVVRSVRMAICTDAGSEPRSCGSSAFTRSTTAMMLAPGCRWMLRMTAGTSFIHAACLTFSTSSTTVAMSDEMDRRAVPVGDDQRTVAVAREQLIVGADRVGLIGTVEIAFGLVDVRRGDRGADVFEGQPVRRDRRRIDLNPDRGLLAAADADEADAGQL